MSSLKLPDSVHLKPLMGKQPEPLDFVLPGFVRGTVGGLVSPGGTGKSFWSLNAAVAIGAGAGVKGDLLGMRPKEGRVLMLSKEDPLEVFHQRLHAMGKLLPKSTSFANLDYRSCVGVNIDVMDTEWYAQIRDAAKGARLVILDTLTRFHKLDENSAQDMGQLLAQLERLAADSKAAVLFLHHTSKAATVNGQATLQQAARGSSVLVDNARWCAFLAVMTEAEARIFGVTPAERVNYVRWNISKQNYGAAIPDVWYRRDEGGVLVPIHFTQKKLPAPVTAAPCEPETTVVSEPKASPQSETPPLPSATGAYGGNW